MAQLKRHSTYRSNGKNFLNVLLAHGTIFNIHCSRCLTPHMKTEPTSKSNQKIKQKLIIVFRRVVDVALFDCLIVSVEFLSCATDFSTSYFRMWQSLAFINGFLLLFHWREFAHDILALHSTECNQCVRGTQYTTAKGRTSTR